MSADDPRHGTNAGYVEGCRETCCKVAHAKYKRDHRARVYLAGGPLTVSAVGTHRRIQALMCLGWSMKDISVAVGHNSAWCFFLFRHDHVHRATHDAVAEVYERWCMTVPPLNAVTGRVRAMARKRGYLPPLAWDDIDDPMDRTYAPGEPEVLLDEAVILRVLSGEYLPTTRAEKDEIVRRWVGSGHSEKSLCNRFGWKEGRYGRIPVDSDSRTVGTSRENRSAHTSAPSQLELTRGERPLTHKDVTA